MVSSDRASVNDGITPFLFRNTEPSSIRDANRLLFPVKHKRHESTPAVVYRVTTLGSLEPKVVIR